MGAEDLQDCINQAELLVIPDKGVRFTWSNKWQGMSVS